MNFTKAVYRKARSRAMNEVYSRADILEWAKDSHEGFMDSDRAVSYPEYVAAVGLVDEARTEYFKALEGAYGIIARGRREKGLWRL
jgi:hypothetical protein